MARIARLLPDDRLFDLVQERTFRWFWERAVPGTGMAPDRTTSPKDWSTSGGSGFGIMAIIVAAERRPPSRAYLLSEDQPPSITA